MARKSEKCLEFKCDESFVEGVYREEEDASVDNNRGGGIRRDLQCACGRQCRYPLSSEVFASGTSWSGAGGFEVYLWTERTLSIELELSGGKEGLIGGSEPAVEVELTRMTR